MILNVNVSDKNAFKGANNKRAALVYTERNCLSLSMTIRRSSLDRSGCGISGHEDPAQDKIRTDQRYFTGRVAA